MKTSQCVEILACSAVFLLANVLPAGAYSFSNGSRVETTANLVVHATHSTSGTVITTESEGLRGTIASSSYYDGTYTWWYINWDNGYSGYSVDAYLEPVPTLTVTSPNGGENWTAGSMHTVTWTATGDTSAINYQLVAYSTDGWATYNNVSSTLTPSTRSFSWTLPSGVSSSQVQVRVRAIDAYFYVLAQDTSDGNFTISPPIVAPTVTVTSPNGGENWQVGSSHSITATSSGSITSVEADYSTDGGSTWTYITAYSPLNNTINIPWTVPNTPSTTCKVRIIVGYSGGSVSDSSDANFTISSASGGTVVLSGVPYIQQLYDTADSFTAGNDCCNATAALMAIQYYGKLPANPITCTRGGTHTSNYGFYISSIYSYNGHTYNIQSSAVWGSSDAGYYGGFGYFLQDNPGSSLQRSTRLSEYISYHGLTSGVDAASSSETDFSKVCAEIDAGHPVVLLTEMTTAGHYITCIGYVKGQHTLIFNDSYGNKQSGYPNENGAGVYYDWPGYNNGYANLTAVDRLIYARGGVTDTTAPTIAAFSVTPTTVTLGQSFSMNYTVSDSGGSGLKEVVFRRTSGDGTANDPGWQDIQTATAWRP